MLLLLDSNLSPCPSLTNAVSFLVQGVAALLTTLLYFKQKTLIYPSHVPPNARTDVPRPSQYNFKDYEELIIPTNDGEKLSAFYIRGPRRRGPNSKVTVLSMLANNDPRTLNLPSNVLQCSMETRATSAIASPSQECSLPPPTSTSSCSNTAATASQRARPTRQA